MIMGTVEGLAAEIRRVVTSPYSVSLKSLHDILQHTNAHDLRNWADGNGCQIDALAAAVLAELQLWPYTLDIVQKLASITAFRDAVLCQKATILNGLLVKARQSPRSDPGPNSYEKTCISMLLTRLPNGHPVPASLPAFLLGILDKASDSPSVITLKPFYSLITGVGTGLLDILPSKSIVRLQGQLIDILSRSVQDPSVSLLCLAVLARITADRDEEVNQDDPYYPAKRLFNRKASKTLDLVVLWAVQMCSTTTLKTTDGTQAMENLQLAAEIICVVNAHARSTWVAMPTNLSLTRRLQGKILRQEVSRNIQMAVLAIVSSLDDVASLPDELVLVLESALEWSPLPPGAEAVIEKYACRFSAKFVHSQLAKLLMTSKPYTYNSDAVVSLKTARSITISLAGAIKSSSSLRQRITTALMSTDLRDPLQQFLAYKHSPDRVVKHSHHEACPCIVEDNQRRLLYSISILLLESVLHASDSETRFDPSLASSLLAKLEALSVPLLECLTFMAHDSPREGSLSLFEVSSTPAKTMSDKSWREQLRESLLQESARKYEIGIQIMDRVCRELEARCDTAERPFREEQARSKDLGSQLETLKAENGKLECEAQEYRTVLDGLESEKKGLADQIEDAEIRLERSLEELKNLQGLHEQEKQQAAVAARKLEVAANQRELEYLATKAADDKMIDEQSSQLSSFQAQSKVAEDKITILSSEASTFKKRVNELEVMIQERDDRSTETNLHMRKSETEIVRLLQVELDRSSLVESLQSQVQDLLTAAKKTEVDLTANISCLRLELADLQQKYDSDLALKESKLIEQEGRFNQTVMQLQREVDRGKDEANTKAKHQERLVSGLEEKIGKLRKERDKHVREAAEAQFDMKNRMMAVIGVQPGLPAVMSPQVELSVISTYENLPIIEDQVQHSPTQDFLRSFGSSTSNRSGSTPKRSKPRRNTKTPTMRQPRISSGSMTVRGAHTGFPRLQRQPLRDLAFDGRNSCLPSSTHRGGKFGDDDEPSTFGQAEADDHIHGADEMGDVSFGDSGIFASTDHQRENSNGLSTGRGIYDETTADFYS